MRILLITARYLPHRGGLETVVAHLAQQYRAAGHTVAIVTNRYPRTLPARERIAGTPIRRLMFLYPRLRDLRAGRLDLFAAGCLLFWPVLAQCRRLVRRYQPDVVNLHYVGAPAPFVWMLHRTAPFPLVVSLHGGDVDSAPDASWFDAWLFRAVLAQADGVTACSASLAGQARRRLPDRAGAIEVVPNGVDWVRFATARPYLHPRLYVAAVGQLAAHKGFDLLIDAFGDVAPAFPGVDLLIAGAGAERAALATQIATRGLADRVRLVGRLDEDGVAGLLAGSLFVAMPSRREPFGIVALEGMAAGRRVLATPVGGIPEFLPRGANRMVEPARGAWVAALADWLTDMPAASESVVANQAEARSYSWELVAGRYLELYQQARGGVASPRHPASPLVLQGR